MPGPSEVTLSLRADATLRCWRCEVRLTSSSEVITSDDASAKVMRSGELIAAQPRIRLLRSFDERSHSYLGYRLRLHGTLDGEGRKFSVGIGKAAHAKFQFRVGDRLVGKGVLMIDTQGETADVHKDERDECRGPVCGTGSARSPFTSVPPELEVYRALGHRRFAAATFSSKCIACQWGCEMPVEMIVDKWNPSKARHRRESFCYGPKSCPIYKAGSPRTVPGRKGANYVEEDWVDEQATEHRVSDD